MADTPFSDASAPPRPDRVKLIVIAVVALLAVGGVFLAVGQYQRRQPQWSLAQIPTAIEEKDVATFKKHVDLESVIEQAIDDMAATRLADLAGSQGPLGGLVEGLGQGMLDAMKPQLVAGGVSLLEDAIEDGSAPGVSESKMQQSATDLRAQIAEATVVSREGKTIVMAVPPGPEAESTEPIQVHMRQLEDGTWQVTRISSLEGLMPALPAIALPK